mmetsp:Transcript_2517/g.4248  ORF Transcript_2517/g.4248 Transcript_2517/m.4248 type:complete len:208 (-) Transcript_2517:617-1240(-)
MRLEPPCRPSPSMSSSLPSAAAARRAATESNLARRSPREARRGKSSSPARDKGLAISPPKRCETFWRANTSASPPLASAPVTPTRSDTSSAKSPSRAEALRPALRVARRALAWSLERGTRMKASSSSPARASRRWRILSAAILSKPGRAVRTSSGAPATSAARSAKASEREARRRASTICRLSSRERANRFFSSSPSMLTGLSLGGL